MRGGSKWTRNIPQVRWSNGCKPKKEGGLCNRDLRFVNFGLFGKWRWRLIWE